ncbi:MAG: TonB-dependent receptor [Terracidiphilus sp.]|nr:TonB-dependent receptor [Terracidiphilus sp.]
MVLFIAALVLIGSHNAFSQSTQGSILGMVSDASGAVIPNADIVLTYSGIGIQRHQKSNVNGEFEFNHLEPGIYRLSIAANGFAKLSEDSIFLDARQQLRLHPFLKVSGTIAEVSVSAYEQGVINTESPNISTSLNAEEVINLPANYRGAGSTSPLNIIQTLPGVQPDTGSFPPSPTASDSPAVNFSIQGGLPSQADTTVDGISAQNVLSNSPLADAFPSAESIAEIRVDGVGNNAEFGQPAAITTVSKSGGESYHGTAFWYFQNSGFDATPYGSATKPKKVANDFGFSTGGPARIPGLINGSKHTFFFATYEGFQYPQTVTEQYLVPTDLMKSGNFINEVGANGLSNPFKPGTIFTNAQMPSINSSAKAFLSLFPSPNYGNTTSAARALADYGYNYVVNRPQTYSSNQFDVRLDHYFGTRALLFGRYTQKNIKLLQPNSLLLPDSSNYENYRILASSFNYNFTPRLTNEFRFGFTLEYYGTSNPLNGASYTNAAGFTGVGPSYPFNGITELNFSHFTSLNADHLDQDSAGKLFQYNDILSWNHGRHAMRFGFDVRSMVATPPTQFYGADNYGNFTFTGLLSGNEFADFLLGVPSMSEVDNLPGTYKGQSSMYAVFAEDTWKITQRFNLVYGLRYELHPPYLDPAGDIGNFDPSVKLSGRAIYPTGKENILSANYLADINACAVSGVSNPYATGATINGAPCTPVVSSSAAGLPDGLRNYPKLRFSPRIGFAWRPTGSDKMSVSGGFGVYNITTLGSGYYSLTAALQANTREYYNSLSASGPGYSWPSINYGGSSIAAPEYGTAYFGTGADINWKDPYSMQWNLSVNREIAHGIGARLSYIALRTDQLVWRPNANDMGTTTIAVAQSGSNTSLSVRPLTDRPFPNWGTINMNSTGATANYQSLQAQLNARLHHGGGITSAYTYAESVADNQGAHPSSFAGENGGGRATWGLNRKLDFGNVYGSRKHRWISTATLPLPIGRGQQYAANMSPTLNTLFGGWNLSGIFLVQSGPSLTPYIPGGDADPSGTGSGSLVGRAQRPDQIGNGVPHQRNRTHWLDPNSFACPSNDTLNRIYAGNSCTVGVNSLPIGRFGTERVGSVNGPGTVNLSAGLNKSIWFSERVKLRAEGTFTNVLNHANLADPNLDFTSASFGKITQARGSDFAGSRTGQVSMRLEF